MGWEKEGARDRKWFGGREIEGVSLDEGVCGENITNRWCLEASFKDDRFLLTSRFWGDPEYNGEDESKVRLRVKPVSSRMFFLGDSFTWTLILFYVLLVVNW